MFKNSKIMKITSIFICCLLILDSFSLAFAIGKSRVNRTTLSLYSGFNSIRENSLLRDQIGFSLLNTKIAEYLQTYNINEVSAEAFKKFCSTYLKDIDKTRIKIDQLYSDGDTFCIPYMSKDNRLITLRYYLPDNPSAHQWDKYSLPISNSSVKLICESVDKSKKVTVKTPAKNKDKEALKWLVTRPVGYDWKKAEQTGQLKHLKGLTFSNTFKRGRIHFRPIYKYFYEWNIFKESETWSDVKIEDFKVKNNKLEITVKLSKKDDFQMRIFEIGNKTKMIYGRGTEKGKTKEVLDIQPKKQGLSWLVTRPVDYDWKEAEEQGELEHLKGLKLGKTFKRGKISFSPIFKYNYEWSIFGVNEQGWQVEITDVVVRKNTLELIVKLTKEDKVKSKVYEIGKKKKKIFGNGSEKGKTKEVLDIQLKKTRLILGSNKAVWL